MNHSRISSYASVLVLLIAIVLIVGAKPIQEPVQKPVQKPMQRATAKNQIAKRATNRLVVHEWGTFTSIAGKNGVSIEWRPLGGESDLPSFVYDLSGLSGAGLRSGQRCIKCNMEALVRMETPVIYFYADRETSVSVRVFLSSGKITEWYPKARHINGSTPSDGIDWGRITVLPGGEENFPVETKPSHYYPARETDAATLRVCNVKGEEREKFLFYRGVGNFDPPLAVTLDGGRVSLSSRGSEVVTKFILFESHNGHVGYVAVDSFNGEAVIQRPSLNESVDNLEQTLEATLVAEGLYKKEALAMIKTWRDSWFEEGVRVFYIVPRKVTDSILPLTIEPQPSEISRVLVGRIEIITPELEEEITMSLSDSSRDLNEVAEEITRKHGRFAEPVLKSVLEKTSDPALRKRIQQLLNRTGTDTR